MNSLVDTSELDEPAWHTHTPLGWPIEEITFHPSGRAPKTYGPNAFRFDAAVTLSVILPRRGWTLLKKTKNYAYLAPPPDQLQQPFRILIAVPTAEELIALAQRCFARGGSWLGQLGEWPAMYLHDFEAYTNRVLNTRADDTCPEPHLRPLRSYLSIGEWGIWEAKVDGVDGKFVPRQISEAARTRDLQTR